MTGGTTQRLEVGLDAAAATLLGAATAFVLLRFDASNAYALAGAAIVCGWGFYGLRSIEPEPATYVLSPFSAAEFEPAHPAELPLDDALTDVGPGSRVVRLFDRAAMPASPGPEHPDASQALYDALARLRRSLR